VTAHPVSLEQDVKGVVTKVRLGEADAGIAYVTDVSAAKGTIDGTALPGVSNSYPIAVVKQGADAQAFCDFLLSPNGQSVLASFGFLPPS
jgi:molybdate transport system substrate-binding protein